MPPAVGRKIDSATTSCHTPCHKDRSGRPSAPVRQTGGRPGHLRRHAGLRGREGQRDGESGRGINRGLQQFSVYVKERDFYFTYVYFVPPFRFFLISRDSPPTIASFLFSSPPVAPDLLER